MCVCARVRNVSNEAELNDSLVDYFVGQTRVIATESERTEH